MTAGGTVLDHVGSAAVKVARDEYGDLIIILEAFDLFADLFGSGAAQQEANGAETDLIQTFDRLFSRLDCGAVEEEELTDFIVEAHLGKGIFDPGDLFIVQIEGFCTQIYA